MKSTTDRRPGFWLRAIEYRKHQLMREERRALRDSLADRAREGISDEDYATTMATLEAMARNLGFTDEDLPRMRGRRGGPGRRGFGPHPVPWARHGFPMHPGLGPGPQGAPWAHHGFGHDADPHVGPDGRRPHPAGTDSAPDTGTGTGAAPDTGGDPTLPTEPRPA